MAAVPVLPIPTPEEAPLSEGARIVNTFLAPHRTFLDLRRNASWWAPFLLLSIVTLGFFYTIDQKIGFRKVAENQIQQSPKLADRLARLPADQQIQAIGRQAAGLRYFLYGYPAVILLSNLIIAGLLFATFKFAGGADLKFKTSYAIVMYACLPLLVKTLLATAPPGPIRIPLSCKIRWPPIPAIFLAQPIPRFYSASPRRLTFL